MALRWYTLVIQSRDTRAQARWWAEVLDWDVELSTEDESVIVPKHTTPEPITDVETWQQASQSMVFVPVSEHKTVQNRLHIDLAPHTSQDRAAEIERLIQLGATHADVGQTQAESWTVLRDPEGNEFCVLSSRDA